jgi:hypothetical protein
VLELVCLPCMLFFDISASTLLDVAAQAGGLHATLGGADELILMYTLQSAIAAAAADKPWAGSAVAALVSGALGGLQLARAEAAAQAALPSSTPADKLPDPCKPKDTQPQAAQILAAVAGTLTPAVSRALAEHGLLAPLLRVRAADCLPRQLKTWHSAGW